MEIDVLMGPAEFERLAGRELPGVVCVVFDVLRATSTAVTAKPWSTSAATAGLTPYSSPATQATPPYAT